MVIKGSARGGPSALAKHLQRTDENERVTLIGVHGLAADNLEDALLEMDALGAGLRTKCTLYHASINVGPGDVMNEKRWQTASAALREKLELSGQPYVEIEHKKHGRVHRHFVIARTDLEHMRAIRADHNYRKHEEVSRDLERQFGHKRVQGAHAERDGKKRPDRTPNAAEQQQEKRTGVAVKQAKAFVTDLWQSTDSGKALQAALENHGWILARGDETTAKGRAYLMVIDPHGGTHELARRVDGVKASIVHARVADIDPASLPSVAEARAIQLGRAKEREFAAEADKLTSSATAELVTDAPVKRELGKEFSSASARTVDRATPNFDRDVANADWANKVAAAAIIKDDLAGANSQACQPAERETPAGAVEDMRPLGKSAGEICMAWQLSRSAEQLEDALAARGMTLAQVTAEEARQSERTAAFAKEVGHFARALREGEIVVVDGWGAVHRLDQRTTGDLRPDIEKRLSGIDRDTLLDVTTAKQVMREASGITARDEARMAFDMSRPLTAIESTIADALANTMTGIEFAETLDKAGLTIARATAADVRALDTLRRESELAASVARAQGSSNSDKDSRIFAKLVEGDYAAVTPRGDMFRLNPTALDFEEVEQRLADTERRLPGIVEARALLETNRDKAAAKWSQRQKDNALRATSRFEGRASEQTFRDLFATTHKTARGIIATTAIAGHRAFKATRGLLGGASKIIGDIIGFFGGGEPKLTSQQLHDLARAENNQETIHAHEFAAGERADKAAQDWRLFAQRKQQQEQDLRLAQTLGIPPTAEANLGRHPDRGREQERER